MSNSVTPNFAIDWMIMKVYYMVFKKTVLKRNVRLKNASARVSY